MGRFNSKNLFLLLASSLTLSLALVSPIGCRKEVAKNRITSNLPPKPPSNVKVIFSVRADKPFIAITWKDNAKDEDGFRIEGRSREETNYRTIGTVKKNITSFVDTSSPTDKTYYYRVNAYNARGESASQWEGLRLGLFSIINKENVSDFDLLGGVMFLLWRDGLSVLDISNPKKPKIIRTLPLKGYVRKGFLSTTGNTVYIIDDDQLFVMNITNPFNPVFTSALDIGTGAIDLKSVDKALYILKEDSSLSVLDVRNPKKPYTVRSIRIKGNPGNMLIRKGYLLISSAREGILTYDIRSHLTPKYLTSYTPHPTRFFNAIAPWDGKIAASIRDFENEIHIIDAADPLNMSTVSKALLDWIPLRIGVSKNFLIVPESQAGAQILRGVNPLKLRNIGAIEAGIDKVKAWDNIILMSYENNLYLFSVP